jgi:hypothetical protein
VRLLAGFVALMGTTLLFAGPKDKIPAPPVLRWQEGTPGCDLARGEDGKDRYTVSTTQFAITLIVDSQELEKSRRTLGHILSLQVRARLTDAGTLEVRPEAASLELVRHHRVRLPSLDPDDTAAKLQTEADELVYRSEKEIQKHPEKKLELETKLREQQKLTAQWQDFLTTRALRGTLLDGGRSEISGWIFFPARSKWAGDWKEREDFILRLPTARGVIEFPFTLPPQGEPPALRRRPA